jgi:hypothetical protein
MNIVNLTIGKVTDFRQEMLKNPLLEYDLVMLRSFVNG